MHYNYVTRLTLLYLLLLLVIIMIVIHNNNSGAKFAFIIVAGYNDIIYLGQKMENISIE